MKFNVNNYVRVKLTEQGRALHAADHAMFWSKAKRNVPYRPPVEDDEGWSKWPLWSLMEAFGPHLSLGSVVPFDTEIELIGAPSRNDVLDEAARIVEGGSFLHAAAPAAMFAREAAAAIRRQKE